MSWFIGANGDYIGQAASKAAFQAQGYGYEAGPFATAKAAQAWLSSHSGGTSGGGWYVVTFRQNPQAAFTVQVMQKPFPGPPAQALVDSGPYATQAEALTAADKLKAAPIPGLINSPTGLAAIGDFFSKLGEGSTWIRVGEVLLGVILIGIGIARITGAQNVVSQVVKARIP